MRVIRVFSGDKRKPIVDKTPAISSLRACASSFVPATIRHQSSAYAEDRIMPMLHASFLVRAVGGFLMSA
jgi:hypothetical protein